MTAMQRSKMDSISIFYSYYYSTLIYNNTACGIVWSSLASAYDLCSGQPNLDLKSVKRNASCSRTRRVHI